VEEPAARHGVAPIAAAEPAPVPSRVPQWQAERTVVTAGAEPLSATSSVLTGHVDVHDHDVGLQILGHCNALGGGVRRSHHIHTGGLQRAGKQLGEGPVVVHDEHTRRGHHGGTVELGERQGFPMWSGSWPVTREFSPPAGRTLAPLPHDPRDGCARNPEGLRRWAVRSRESQSSSGTSSIAAVIAPGPVEVALNGRFTVNPSDFQVIGSDGVTVTQLATSATLDPLRTGGRSTALPTFVADTSTRRRGVVGYPGPCGELGPGS
jgi:hypothetical protein